MHRGDAGGARGRWRSARRLWRRRGGAEVVGDQAREVTQALYLAAQRLLDDGFGVRTIATHLLHVEVEAELAAHRHDHSRQRVLHVGMEG